MAEELISSYIDRSAISDDTKFLTDQLKEVLDLFEKVNATKITLSGAKSMKEVTDAAKQANKATDELTAGKKKLIEVDVKAQKEAIAAKEAARKLTAELKNQVKEEQAAEGSLNQLRATLSKLKNQFDDLSQSQREAAVGQELLKKLQETDAAVKELEYSTGRFERNVGNYPGAAKIIVDALEKARVKFNDLSKAADTTPAALQRAKSEFEALRGITDNKQFLNFAASAGDATQEVRTFTRTLVNLEAQGLGNSEVAQELRKRLAELTDTIADTRAEVKALSSDTRSFDQFASSVNFAVDVFQTAVGAMTAFGTSEKDAAEATKTLLALQTLSNGVQGIANELTTKGTAANKLYAFAQNQVATAMDTTVAASARLKAALITVGIGALIIGIGLLIKYVIDYRAKLAQSTKAQEDFNKALEEQNSEAAKEITNLRLLTSTAADSTRPYKDRLAAVKKLRAEFGPYFKELKDEQILNGEVAKSIDAAKKAILDRAKARAIEGQIAKATEEQLNLFLKRERVVKNIAEQERKLSVARDQAAKGEATSLKRTLGNTLLEIDQQILDTGANIKALLDRVAAEDIKPPSLDTTEQEKANKKFYDGELKAQADAFKQLSENQDAHLITRLSAREKSFELEKQILAGQKAIEIENAQGDADKILEINNDFIEKRKAQQRQLDIDILNIRQTFIARQREQDQEANEQFFKDQEDALAKQIDNLQDEQEDRFKEQTEGREAELKSLDKWYQQRVKSTREGSKAREKVDQDYAERRAAIEYSYAVAALKTQIEFAEKVLAVRKAAGIDVTEQEKQLSELRIQLSDLETKRVLENNKKQGKSHQEKLEEAKNAIQEVQNIAGQVADVVGSFIDARADKEKNAIQGQINDLDKKKEKEIEAVNASALSEQEKADKVAVINARAAGQKDALERRQRQADLQRARFEKANSIAQAILKTAVAVLEGLIKGGPPLAIIYGAIGAAQIAAAFAAPLPKFKHGRDGGPATWAITGDGGVAEVATSPDLKQAFVTPATDTVTYLPENWKVFPDVDAFNAAALRMTMKPLPAMPIVQNSNDRLIHAMAYSIGRLERAVMNKQETHFHWSNGELYKSIKNGNSWDRYIQGNI